MDDATLQRWFAVNKDVLETAYVQGEQPWQQSGFGLHRHRTYERWEACRKPVADAIDRSGAFLDVGCANGYLLECLLRWTAARGLAIAPYGLDFSERLLAMAKMRLPAYAGHFFLGNAWDWQPPLRFDVVRTELEYVPEVLRAAFVRRLLERVAAPGGALLVAEYRGRDDASPVLTIDRRLSAWGFAVEAVTRGEWEGTEYTRVGRLRPPVAAPQSYLV